MQCDLAHVGWTGLTGKGKGHTSKRLGYSSIPPNLFYGSLPEWLIVVHVEMLLVVVMLLV